MLLCFHFFQCIYLEYYQIIRGDQFETVSLDSAETTGGNMVEELERVMQFNYSVSIFLIQRIYKTMKKEEKGSVVNVCALSGLIGTYVGTAYVDS